MSDGGSVVGCGIIYDWSFACDFLLILGNDFWLDS